MFRSAETLNAATMAVAARAVTAMGTKIVKKANVYRRDRLTPVKTVVANLTTTRTANAIVSVATSAIVVKIFATTAKITAYVTTNVYAPL